MLEEGVSWSREAGHVRAGHVLAVNHIQEPLEIDRPKAVYDNDPIWTLRLAREKSTRLIGFPLEAKTMHGEDLSVDLNDQLQWE
jgi:hypothetical protein